MGWHRANTLLQARRRATSRRLDVPNNALGPHRKPISRKRISSRANIELAGCGHRSASMRRFAGADNFVQNAVKGGSFALPKGPKIMTRPTMAVAEPRGSRGAVAHEK